MLQILLQFPTLFITPEHFTRYMLESTAECPTLHSWIHYIWQLHCVQT